MTNSPKHFNAYINWRKQKCWSDQQDYDAEVTNKIMIEIIKKRHDLKQGIGQTRWMVSIGHTERRQEAQLTKYHYP